MKQFQVRNSGREQWITLVWTKFAAELYHSITKHSGHSFAIIWNPSELLKNRIFEMGLCYTVALAAVDKYFKVKRSFSSVRSPNWYVKFSLPVSNILSLEFELSGLFGLFYPVYFCVGLWGKSILFFTSIS